MYETSAKPAMSSSSSGAGLAIVPDKGSTHRPGGCVGSILFQLFEWNRRFARKKLFPRKLLPPVRATKKVTKKLADEKMPVAKFLLIAADENRGGYPNQKKAPEAKAVSSPAATTPRSSGMRSPSLVVRLMGLEAMPAAAPQDKPRKTVDSLDCHEGSQSSCSSRHDLDLDLEVAGGGHGKQDSRPQKLQKTGFFDRRPASETAARSGSEVLQLNRSVLFRGRKQHHKIASPVKSPRLLSKKNSSRLMGAAVRILEPGLQRRIQARRALTYGNPSQRSTAGVSSLEKPGEQTKKYVSSPCRNCDAGLMEVADRNPRFEQPHSQDADRKPHPSDHSNTRASSSLESLTMNRVKLPLCSREESPFCASQSDSIAGNRDLMDRKQRSQYTRDHCNSNADNVRSRNFHYFTEEKTPSSSSQTGGNADKKLAAYRKQRIPYEKDQRNSMPTRSTHRQTGSRHTQIASALNKTTGPSSCSRQQSRREPGSASGSTGSVVQNRNTNSRAKVLPRPVISAKTETNQEKSLVQRTTPLKGNTQTRGTGGPKATPPKNRNRRATAALITEARFVNAHSRKQDNATTGTGIKATEVVSFTFNAPHRQNSQSHSSAIISRRTKKAFVKTEHTPAAFPAKDMTDLREEPSQRLDTVRGDELSALLEQKIKELNFLEQDESLSQVGSKSGRSSATILQEIISALTYSGVCDTSNQYGYAANMKQEDATEESTGLSPLGFECDQPSPISILEASFSTDSCLSESLNSMSGQVLNFGVIEESCDKSQESWDAEADFSDSATSCNLGEIETDKLSCSLDGISFIYSSNCQFRHPRSRPSYIWALVSYIELLFGEHFAKEDDNSAHKSWVDTLLLGALEMLCNACQAKSGLSSSFPETKGRAHLRRFLCDCMIEHLDSKYGTSIIATREKLTFSSLNSKNLAEDVDGDISRWRELASMNLDDMIEEELRCLPVQWIDFKSEACESGEEIQQDILHALVDEALIEFLPR